jgi:hypothetical protein
LWKFPPKRGEHSAATAASIEDGKFCGDWLDGVGDMLTKGLVPPVMVLDRPHDVVFVRPHPVFGLTNRCLAVILSRYNFYLSASIAKNDSYSNRIRGNAGMQPALTAANFKIETGR